MSAVLYEIGMFFRAMIPGRLVHRNGLCAHCMLWAMAPETEVCPVCFNGWR